MSPNFLPNSFVFAITHPWQKYKIGDVVLVEHASYGKMIKRIDAVNANNTFSLKGDNFESVTTQQMGQINKAQIMGKVFWQVKPPKA